MNIKTVEQIKKLKCDGLTERKIAETLSLKMRTVQYWTAKLRKQGHQFPKHNAGRRPLDLTQLA